MSLLFVVLVAWLLSSLLCLAKWILDVVPFVGCLRWLGYLVLLPFALIAGLLWVSAFLLFGAQMGWWK